MKKYILIKNQKIEFGNRTLYRIQATTSFGDVVAGDLGGYIESEDNLSHDGNAWVSGSAWVFGDARVYGDARVFGSAWVHGDARVYKII